MLNQLYLVLLHEETKTQQHLNKAAATSSLIHGWKRASCSKLSTGLFSGSYQVPCNQANIRMRSHSLFDRPDASCELQAGCKTCYDQDGASVRTHPDITLVTARQEAYSRRQFARL